MIMALSTWSVLQFTVSLTTFKQLPEVDNNIEANTKANVVRLLEKDNATSNDSQETSLSPAGNQTAKTDYGKKFYVVKLGLNK